jgi:hypothetical protein
VPRPARACLGPQERRGTRPGGRAGSGVLPAGSGWQAGAASAG